jgi:hypothetical protein
MNPGLIVLTIVLLPLYMIPLSAGIYMGKVCAIRFLFGKEREDGRKDGKTEKG